jgi:hypothetical protein
VIKMERDYDRYRRDDDSNQPIKNGSPLHK